MEYLFDIIKIIIAIAILIPASISDIKKREASNKFWIFIFLSAIALNSILIIKGDMRILDLGFPVLATALILFLYDMRIIAGGADAKALISLFFLFPLYPAFCLRTSFMPFPFVLLINCALFGGIIAICYAAKNRSFTLEFPMLPGILISTLFSCLVGTII